MEKDINLEEIYEKAIASSEQFAKSIVQVLDAYVDFAKNEMN